LAVKIGVSIATISRWERGQSEPRIEDIIGISEALGLSIDELLGGGVAAPDPMPDALMLFLRTTGGRMAIEAGLLPTLRHLRTLKPPTVELYSAITVALLGAGAGED
jgi:transcriptional regulator with XRE-family HTH domain